MAEQGFQHRTRTSILCHSLQPTQTAGDGPLHRTSGRNSRRPLSAAMPREAPSSMNLQGVEVQDAAKFLAIYYLTRVMGLSWDKRPDRLWRQGIDLIGD